jgi:hypothetical protein
MFAGFARLEGHPVAVVANNPMQLAVCMGANCDHSLLLRCVNAQKEITHASYRDALTSTQALRLRALSGIVGDKTIASAKRLNYV